MKKVIFALAVLSALWSSSTFAVVLPPPPPPAPVVDDDDDDDEVQVERQSSDHDSH